MQIIGCDLASGKDRLAITIIGADGKPSMVIDRDTFNALNASRKADREDIAWRICAIVERHGATVERRDDPPTRGYSGASICLRFTLNGLGAMIDIDNLHGGAWSLVSWYPATFPTRNLSARFMRHVALTPFARPHHKATSHPRDWYSLAMFLDAGLCLAARGEAFEPFDL